MKARSRKDKDAQVTNWIQKGVIVNYHSIIGGPVTHYKMCVSTDPFQCASGHWVVFLEGKSGYVSIDSLSPYVEEDNNKPLSN